MRALLFILLITGLSYCSSKKNRLTPELKGKIQGAIIIHNMEMRNELTEKAIEDINFQTALQIEYVKQGMTQQQAVLKSERVLEESKKEQAKFRDTTWYNINRDTLVTLEKYLNFCDSLKIPYQDGLAFLRK